MSSLDHALPALAPAAAAQPAGGGSSMFILLMFAALAVLMFISMRRAKKVQTQQAEMRRGLTPGQEVMTTSGIFGRVVRLDESEQRATLEVAPGIRMDFHLQGIASVVEPTGVDAAADGPVLAAPTAAPTTDPRVAPESAASGSTAADVVDPGHEGTALRTDRP